MVIQAIMLWALLEKPSEPTELLVDMIQRR
jgi:hypothetical protein